MRDTGKTINVMVTGRRVGRTAQNLRETINLMKRMVKGSSSTVTEIPLLGNSRKARKMEKAL